METLTANNASTNSVKNKHKLGKKQCAMLKNGKCVIYVYYGRKLRNLGTYETRQMGDDAYHLMKAKVTSSQESYNTTEEIDGLTYYVRNTIRGGHDSRLVDDYKRKRKSVTLHLTFRC